MISTGAVRLLEPRQVGGPFAEAIPASTLAAARTLYADRRRRDELFRLPGMFGEPAWDILLDLFIATHEGRTVSVSSACIGSAVPQTTALRWLRFLEAKELIERESDTHDRRRANLRVTAKATMLIREFFERCSAG
jgi:hypothetical protein